MKKTTFIFSFIAIVLLVFTSCSNDSELISQGANQDYRITFTLNNGGPVTRDASAEGDAGSAEGVTLDKKDFTTAALDREKAISSLYAVAFNKADDSFYKTIKIVLSSASDAYEFNMLKGGAFKLLLVANASVELAGQLTKLTPESTLNDFSSIVATQDAGENAADNGGENAGATNFLMISEVKTDVVVSANSTIDLGAVELIRLAARFDFYNQVKGFKMTKLTFTKRAASSSLADLIDQSNISFTTDKVYTSANGLDVLSSVGAIYSYENEISNDCEFTLEGTFNGKAIDAQSIKFKDLAIERNHLYNIIITADESAVTPSPDDPEDLNGLLNYQIDVADWNEAETFGFVGDQLVNMDAPTFVVSGTGVVITPATEFTPIVVTAPKELTVVTLTATSASSSDSQLTCCGELPSAWHIVDKVANDISSKDGKLIHRFTIEMAANKTHKFRVCTFEIANLFDLNSKVTFTLKQESLPPNPLDCVAEYNLAGAGVFATEHSTAPEKNGWFTGTQILNKYNNIAPPGYHVPNVDEFRVVVPYSNIFTDRTDDLEVAYIMHGKTYPSGKYDSKKISNNLIYALRFKDKDGHPCAATCAYRYKFNFSSASAECCGMTVTCRTVGASFSGTINTICKESYWTSNSENDVTRFFPSCGHKASTGQPVYGMNSQGYYWTCSKVDESNNIDMDFENTIFAIIHENTIFCMPVRLVCD